MKINPINKFFKKHYLPIALLWGTAGFLAGGAVPSIIRSAKNTEENSKKEIQIKDPARYERLVAADTTDFFSKEGVSWTAQRKEMEDSLRMDSIIQKAYFEGAQMVRDSIANANKE